MNINSASYLFLAGECHHREIHLWTVTPWPDGTAGKRSQEPGRSNFCWGDYQRFFIPLFQRWGLSVGRKECVPMACFFGEESTVWDQAKALAKKRMGQGSLSPYWAPFQLPPQWPLGGCDFCWLTVLSVQRWFCSKFDNNMETIFSFQKSNQRLEEESQSTWNISITYWPIKQIKASKQANKQKSHHEPL